MATPQRFLENLTYLLDNGTDINYTFKGETLLYVASSYNCLDLVQFLISKGADINKPNSYMVTPLMIAVIKNHKETVAYLLEHGADPNKQEERGFTCLHYCKNVKIAKLLLDAGCDLTLINNKGLTAKDYMRNKARHNEIANLIEQYEFPVIKEPDLC